MKAPTGNSGPKVLCPRGTHLSRLVQIVDLGTQHFKPGDDGSRKIYFGFETCEAKHVFKEENGEEPFMLQTEFAFFMSKTSKLKQFVVQWFGKDFASEDEARAFDFSKLLNRVAFLTVAHKPRVSDGAMKAVIADIYAPEKEVAASAPKAHNKLVCYEIESGEDENFAKLPGFLQKKIKESDEFTKKPDSQEAPEHEPPAEIGDSPSVPEDDIPF